jgi:hypothetical protein
VGAGLYSWFSPAQGAAATEAAKANTWNFILTASVECVNDGRQSMDSRDVKRK